MCLKYTTPRAISKANLSPADWDLTEKAIVLASCILHHAERPLSDAEWDFYQAHQFLVNWWIARADEEGWVM